MIKGLSTAIYIYCNIYMYMQDHISKEWELKKTTTLQQIQPCFCNNETLDVYDPIAIAYIINTAPSVKMHAYATCPVHLIGLLHMRNLRITFLSIIITICYINIKAANIAVFIH